jgi:G3E family GTPase
MEDFPTRVTIVTGSLGAGKTTLLNHWLLSFNRGDAVVIVNEFGDIGVDGELLAERAREVIELTGGCVCCTTQADLVRALLEFSTRVPPPARVFVETSGAASPASVVRTVTRGPVARRMTLDGVITVVDATHIQRIEKSLLCAEQVSFADVLVLSRTEICTPETLEHAEQVLSQCNPAAVYARSSRGILADNASLDDLLARRSEDFTPSLVWTRPEVVTHDPGLEAVSITHPGFVDGDRFGSWIEGQVSVLGGRLMRMKGIVAIEGVVDRVVLQGVTDQVEVTFAAPWGETPPTCRIVLIGYGLDRTSLEAGFAECAISKM